MKSPLWHKTGATAPLVNVVADSSTYTDDTISSIEMKRGAQNRPAGITPAVATVEVVAARRAALFDSTLTVDLTSYALDLFALPQNLARRWTGRIGTQTVKDPGPNGQKRTTSITANSWSSQVALATKDQHFYGANKSIADMLKAAWTGTQVPTTLTMSGDSDTAYYDDPAAGLAVPGNEVWTKWAADLGVLISTRRDGSARGYGLYSRELAAEAWRSTFPIPLMRRHCLSPAEWKQHATNPAVVRWTYRDRGNNSVYTREVGGGWTGRVLGTIDIDTSYASQNTDNQSRFILATAVDAGQHGYRIESVTIDMVYLATSDVAADRSQFIQLLTLEEGDPIALAWDWPTHVAGVYFASEITETITPQSWRITLALDAVIDIVGKNPDPSGTTWDTRWKPGTTWDSLTGTWDTI